MAIKRHESLQSFSREHHQGLVLCRKIEKGLDKNIPPLRIKAYADWFYQNHLVPHFTLEEKFVFPVLGNTHTLVIQALNEHQELHTLFHESDNLKNVLKKILEKLKNHIRFEERILFNAIQEVASKEELQTILQKHKETDFCDNLTDEFWK